MSATKSDSKSPTLIVRIANPSSSSLVVESGADIKNERMFHLSPSFAPFCPSTALPTKEKETSPTSSAGAVHDTVHPFPTSE